MSIIKDIIYESANYGANKMALTKAAGFSLATLDDGDYWVGLEEANKVWELALAATRKEHLGLHIGLSSNPHVIGLLGYLMESCPELATAFAQLTRFNALFGNMFSYHHEATKDHFIVYYNPHPEWWRRFPHTAQQAIETSMSRTLSIIKRFTGKSIFPSMAHFNYPCPVDTSDFQAILKTNLYFNAGYNALVFSPDLASLPVASHNITLYQEFERLAQEKLNALKATESLENSIKQMLLSSMDNSLPTLEQVADQMHCSPRTLQRKLQKEGTNFQLILENIRKDLAIQFLAQQHNKPREVASFLGYADPRVFRRAFKRWTGKSPAAFILDKTTEV